MLKRKLSLQRVPASPGAGTTTPTTRAKSRRGTSRPRAVSSEAAVLLEGWLQALNGRAQALAESATSRSQGTTSSTPTMTTPWSSDAEGDNRLAGAQDTSVVKRQRYLQLLFADGMLRTASEHSRGGGGMAGRAPVFQSFVPNELQRKASTLEALAHYAECSCSRGRAPTPTLTGARPHLLRLLRPPALALLRRPGATRRASEAVAVVAPVTVQE